MQRESRFTGPSAHCQHPEYWTAEDMESTENEVVDLVAAFVRALQPEYVVETGTAFAQSSMAIGAALKRNGHGRLVTLEISEDRVLAARRACEGLPVEVVHRSSLEWLPEEPIGFLWLDSVGSIRAQELLRYLPWLTARTIVGIHDTAPHHPTRSFLEPLAAAGLIRPIYLHTPRGVAFAEVLATASTLQQA